MNWRDRADRLRAVPLPTVLAKLGADADPSDRAKWRTALGVLSIHGAKFMNWTQGVGGGGAIDLVMHVRQCGFGQALRWLEDRFGFPATTSPSEPLSPPSLTLPLSVPRNWPRVERYLVQTRHLPLVLFAPLVQSGVIYADARANAVFLLGDVPSSAVGAELRGTTGTDWRGMALGSRKDHGYFGISVSDVQAIVLCESAIDALSCHLLHPAYRCLSTSGARPAPAWLNALLALGLPIYCGFDADATGDAMAERMIELYPLVRRLRPPAKDWNECLRQTRC